MLYASHRGRVEGVHGEAKTWHGLARAIRRGLANMQIQAFLTAAVINLKRLADAVLLALFAALAAAPPDSPITGGMTASPSHHTGRQASFSTGL